MRKTINFKKDSKSFEMNLAGFIEAVSFKESSSDLSLSLSHQINIKSARNVNEAGYMGLFQWGEAALYDLGYYLGDRGISYADIKGVNKKSSLYKNWQSQFDSNKWSGKWSGKRNINSKEDFLKKPEIQYEIIQEWIGYLCNQIRNNNFNEHFGRVVQNVEITESGAIAGMHLVGIRGLGAFLGIPKFKGAKQTDGNETHIKKYIEDFGNFDLEKCCNRKIHIGLTDASKKILANKEVTIVSSYNGKSFSGETRVKVRSDANGNLPVIVRHPNTEIKIVADGKESNSIIQKENEKQKAILSDFKVSSHSATLEVDNTPQPRPQVNKTPQDVRNEQTQPSKPQETGSARVSKDINFNIQIVEGDSGRAISNMNFFLTYKGNIRKHTADSLGIKRGIVAEEGHDVEVSVEGLGEKQPVHHFKVSAALKNKMVKVSLPVHFFNISVTQDGKPVPNTLFSIFYRDREIPKRTNSRGVISVRMLTGFVYGFGIKGECLVLNRVENSNATQHFTVNGTAVRTSKLYEADDVKRKQANEDLKKQQQQNEALEKKAKQEAIKAKAEVDKKDQAKQTNTYTENRGKPLTTVSNQAPPTSDTTRYHIYHDGKIKRENKAATGFAEYIYYDKNGGIHKIGKTPYIKAPTRKIGNAVTGGTTYLVDQRTLAKYRSPDRKIGYEWIIYLPNRERYYIRGDVFAAILGTLCSLDYNFYHGAGFSTRDGRSVGSKSHINGINGDFRYLGKNGSHRQGPMHVTNPKFDWDANAEWVKAFNKFGFKEMLSWPVSNKGGKLLPHTKKYDNHHDHLHLQGFAPDITDI